MTLSTYLVANVETDVPTVAEQLYTLTRDMLGTPADYEPERGPDKYQADCFEISHRPGLGLPAWLLMKYRPGGPVERTYVPSETDDEDDREYYAKEYKVNAWKNGAGTVEINWDTAYGFRGANGESCSDLHALYIVAVGRWLDERGIAWSWRNEFTGEWHVGTEGLKEFADVFRPGGDADAWFTGSVLPLIAALGGVQA